MVRTGGRLPALGMVRMAQGFQHREEQKMAEQREAMGMFEARSRP